MVNIELKSPPSSPPKQPPELPDMTTTKVTSLTNSWFTPRRLLFVFCVINLLNYVDRGVIASNGVNGSARTCDDKGVCNSGTGIQGAFNLNNFQDGVLSSAFMVGLLISSPIFATLANSLNPFRLIGVGLSVWTLATAGCGISWNFCSIVIFRMLVGVGEASFISLASPFIYDTAPVASKTAWLAMFFMCIPAGIAVGFGYGGLVGANLNWRYAFWGEAILMLPFAIMGFVMKPLQLRGFTPVSKKASVEGSDASNVNDLSVQNEGVINQPSNKADKRSFWCQVCGLFSQFWKDLKVLLLDKVYVVNVLGYTFYNFVIGAYSYWGPKAGYNVFHMKNADMVFGGITIICGIGGTLAGGFILDRMNATISNAFKLLALTSFFGAAFCFASFCLKKYYGFVALFTIGELIIFATQAPVNYVCLHCVKPSLRPLSVAVSTVAIHILGDVPSAPLVGLLQDHIHDWRKTTLILTTVLFLASATWFIGIFFKSVDKFNQDDDENQVSKDSKPILKPVLEEKKEEA
ncbi:hypothetical protein ACFE04_002134 [Oxalis oulophora]